MATEVVVTEVFVEWFRSLTYAEQISVGRIVDLLEEKGVDLKSPYSTDILGASISMRELRIQHKGSPYRVLYTFDPIRQAVLLLGGNKQAKGNRWYEPAIRDAERAYAAYLKEIGY